MRSPARAWMKPSPIPAARRSLRERWAPLRPRSAQRTRHRRPAHADEARTTMIAYATAGYADKEIAYHLGLERSTVTTHLAMAMRKLGIASRVELAHHQATASASSDGP